MKVIKISELKIGMRFSKPLMLDRDNIFLNEKVPLSESDINRLAKFGFKEVMTLGEPIEEKQTVVGFEVKEDQNTLKIQQTFQHTIKHREEFSKIYREGFEQIQNFYRKVSEDKQPDISQLRTVGESIVDHVRSNPNVSYLLLQHHLEGYYLYNQVIRSTFYSILISQAMEYSRPKMIDLSLSCLLADIGMAKIPSYVSEKTGTLNEDEYKVIMKHPLLGYQLLTKTFKLKNSLATIALQHHENYDGTGYPQKLKKQDIDEQSCIFSIADNFCALISNRPWRRKFLPYDAMKTMISVTMNKFDLNILRIFLNKISMYPIGSFVELSDGSIGQVVDTNHSKMLRPSLLIIRDLNGEIPSKEIFLNLEVDSKVYITKAIEYNII
ncbi:MAG: HD domain-containing phosphohydrolase [Leptospiraceae bacterium]|nr:HD domain-containing phosphohydrolase [Leptospiraceae bacterium]